MLFFILGLVFGSFGSVLVTRTPGSSSIFGRSRCPQCKKTLTPVELIPVLSYCVLRGKCKDCKVKIGWMYPTIELLSGLLFLAAWFHHSDPLSAILLALILWALLLIGFIDMYTQTISDLLNIPLLPFAILYSLLLGQFAVSGMVLGVAFFGAQWIFSKGKWLGSGDVILAAGIGALLGSWERMVVFFFLTYAIGALITSGLLLSGYVKRGQYVAFAPFMVIGAMATVFFQARIDQFIALYIGI
jgi:prepilin signal peptidase PulO-like enzyme (type II secretory pathway)